MQKWAFCFSLFNGGQAGQILTEVNRVRDKQGECERYPEGSTLSQPHKNLPPVFQNVK
jgi:hypothetical protein